uniref:Uncharacterized protein n=1 Tax=Oryza brachyantha TaxID=4533 RepID=J3L591_ORYBR
MEFTTKPPTTSSYLILDYTFARQIWHPNLFPPATKPSMSSQLEGDYLQWWKDCHILGIKEQRKGLDGLIVCTTWSIWLERNNGIFSHNYFLTLFGSCRGYVV